MYELPQEFPDDLRLQKILKNPLKCLKLMMITKSATQALVGLENCKNLHVKHSIEKTVLLN